MCFFRLEFVIESHATLLTHNISGLEMNFVNVVGSGWSICLCNADTRPEIKNVQHFVLVKNHVSSIFVEVTYCDQEYTIVTSVNYSRPN